MSDSLFPAGADFDLAYGHVTNVKSIPSRGVTRIEIEVPTEHHVALTALLHSRGALVFPMWERNGQPPIPYGVTTLSKLVGPQPRQNAVRPEARHAEVQQAPSGVSGFSSTPRRGRDFVRECALRCKEKDFWEFLSRETSEPVNNEDTAIAELRELLGIGSRSELRDNVRAQRAYDELIATFVGSKTAHG